MLSLSLLASGLLLANNVNNLEGNLNIPVNTSPIIPYTCNITSTQLSNNNVYRTTVHNITDVSNTSASYVPCNFVESQSHAPECTVSPFVNISKNKKSHQAAALTIPSPALSKDPQG